jgi:hypothetical protein
VDRLLSSWQAIEDQHRVDDMIEDRQQRRVDDQAKRERIDS